MRRGNALTVGNPPPLPEKERPDAAIKQYLGIVRRFFARRVPPSEIDDMVQNVALRIEARTTGAPIENVEGYAYQVARSVMMDRRRRAEARYSGQHFPLEERDHPVEELTPQRIAEGRDALQQALDLLDDLPDRTRQVFLLHRFDHMPYSAIARNQGISVSAVEKHIMKAMRQLSTHLSHD